MNPDPGTVAALRDCTLFDGDWYRARYPDVALLRMDPLEHFVRVGARLLRDPGPAFDTAHYLATHLDVLRSGMNPLLHYERHGRAEGRACRPSGHAVAARAETPPEAGLVARAGARLRIEGRRSVLACAHEAGRHAFGGERSLLDLLDGLADIDCNVYVAAPPGGSLDYRLELLARSVELFELPLRWWREDRAVDPAVVACFARIIAAHDIDAVHANTLMLHEPLVAAREAGIPAITHVRELVEHDPDICEAIGADARVVRDRVLQRTDWIIANSRRTAEAFATEGRTVVVPNTVDETLFALEPPAPGPVVRIAMVSSNLPKKGLADFFAVARLLEASMPQARFLVVGPRNDHVARQRARRDTPANIEFPGYRASPAEAIGDADVVVNLSRFQESFGRTVLEAMAGARAVVAYEWGALPELIVDGETGLLVPFGDLEAVAANLEWLCADPRRIVALGRAGRERARAAFDRERYAARLREAYDRIWDATEDSSSSTCGASRADQLLRRT